MQGRRGEVDNGEHFDRHCASDARLCRNIHSARNVSGVTHRDLNFAAQKVLDPTECSLSERLAQENLERHVLDNVCVDFDRHVANL